MDKTVIQAGEIICLENGSYADKMVVGHYVALADIDHATLVDALKLCVANKTSDPTKWLPVQKLTNVAVMNISAGVKYRTTGMDVFRDGSGVVFDEVVDDD